MKSRRVALVATSAVLWLLAGSEGRCEEGRRVVKLDLPQAIRLAILKNFRIQESEFGPKIAKARQRSAAGAFDPTLEVSYTRDVNNQELRTLNSNLEIETTAPGDPTPDLFAVRQGNELDSAVVGLAPWGLTYDIGASVIWDTNTQREPDFTRYESFLGIGITQPLLRNFGTDVNLAEIRIARADRAISGWQLRREVTEVITETIRVYSELCFAIENVAVEKRSRALAAQLVRDNTRRAEIGVMAPLDILQARADLAARDERLLVAERAVADNENFLKQLITDEVAGILGVGVQPAPPRLPESPPVDRVKDFARAFEVRPDYREALLDLQKREINVVFTRNQALPRLDLVASFGLNGIDKDFAASFQRVSGQAANNLAWNVGAIFSVPIPNRTGTGNLEAAKLETARALVGLKRIEQAILVEADNAAGQIETTRKRIEAAAAAREFAAATLDAAQARLASGTITTFEVLQFQRDFANAEVSELRARADHIIALAEYARTIGATIERNRVVLE
jgi:outer membrane protein TolC